VIESGLVGAEILGQCILRQVGEQVGDGEWLSSENEPLGKASRNSAPSGCNP
jgi:hypothetical protein